MVGSVIAIAAVPLIATRSLSKSTVTGKFAGLVTGSSVWLESNAGLGTLIVSSIAIPVLLNWNPSEPPRVKPGTPTSEAVPEASSAKVVPVDCGAEGLVTSAVLRITSPRLASSTSTPVASGFGIN